MEYSVTFKVYTSGKNSLEAINNAKSILASGEFSGIVNLLNKDLNVKLELTYIDGNMSHYKEVKNGW